MGNELCGMVSLDVEGAFDLMHWSILADIIDQLSIHEYLKASLKNYISKRNIGFDFSSGIREFVAFHRCPQDSCLGPLLWSLVADKLNKEYDRHQRYIISRTLLYLKVQILDLCCNRGLMHV